MKNIALTLIPTPLAEALPLEPIALTLLQKHALDPQALILVEEHKVARRRWIQWGLPREAIDRFILLNEHTQKDSAAKLIQELKAGKQAFLMSDGGLPAFYDPGQGLVNLCHEANLRVSATPFANSMILAVALSGFSHLSFFFAGFLSADGQERKAALKHLAQTQNGMIVIMDTPYRLKALLNDLKDSPLSKRKVFLGLDLQSETELLLRGTVESVSSQLGDDTKREFILVLNCS